MLGRILDRAIAVFSPQMALRRLQARHTIEQLFGAATGGRVGYDAVIPNRLQRCFTGREICENDLPHGQITRLRWLSWQLYRTTPQARKAVNSLQSKIVGKGCLPNCLATRDDGSAHQEFRLAAERLIRHHWKMCDVRGMPGFGGTSFGQMQRQVIKNVVLSGEVLSRFVQPDAKDLEERPLVSSGVSLLLTIPANRLCHDRYGESGGELVFRGVEFDPRGRRLAYYLERTDYCSMEARPLTYAEEVVKASEILHLLITEDVDQVRGTPWFAAALRNMANVEDYEFDEVTAAKMAACVVLGFRKATGQTQWGLQPGHNQGRPDGNQATHLQPGMIVDLGVDGELQGFNPERPNSNAEAFLNHLIRMISSALPGMKGTTLTGDYRGASYTTERAADNDTWPEIEAIQDWFCDHWASPIYTRWIEEALVSGYFDGIITESEFADRKVDFLAHEWACPTQPSINPKDDVTAAQMRIKAGLSTPQQEAANVNGNWEEILAKIVEFRKSVVEAGLPESYADTLLGILPNAGANLMAASAAQSADEGQPDQGDPAADGQDQETDANVAA